MYFSWDEMRHALLTLSNADLHFFVSLPHILLTFQPHRVYPVVDRGRQDSSALLQQLDCKTIEQWQKGVDDIGQQQFDVVIHIQDEESLITFHINILSAPSRLGKGPISIFLRNSKFYYCKKKSQTDLNICELDLSPKWHKSVTMFNYRQLTAKHLSLKITNNYLINIISKWFTHTVQCSLLIGVKQQTLKHLWQWWPSNYC